VFLTNGYLNPALAESVSFRPNCKTNQINSQTNKISFAARIRVRLIRWG